MHVFLSLLEMPGIKQRRELAAAAIEQQGGGGGGDHNQLGGGGGIYSPNIFGESCLPQLCRP